MKAENVVLPLTILQNYVLVFSQKINRGGEIQDGKVSSISLAPIHVSQALKMIKIRISIENTFSNFRYSRICVINLFCLLRFFVFEFWVWCRILVFFGLILPDVMKKIQVFNTYSNVQLFKANAVSLESPSFVHCVYYIFKLLSAKINFFYILHFRLH